MAARCVALDEEPGHAIARQQGSAPLGVYDPGQDQGQVHRRRQVRVLLGRYRRQRRETMMVAGSESPDAAERMRLYRKRRRRGIRSVRVRLHVTQIDGLIRIGILRQEDRDDPDALAWALDVLIEKAMGDLASSKAGERYV
jgi:hypothetical protein